MQETAYAFGVGVGTLDRHGAWLEVFYPSPQLTPEPPLVELLAPFQGCEPLPQDALRALTEAARDAGYQALATECEALLASGRAAVCTLLAEDAAPDSVPAAYLKLHLLSHRLVRPHDTNLQGLFGTLPNVAWTSEGAIALEELKERQWQARLRGIPLVVHSIDKFPRMTDYVVPSGVRIGDGARIRLGAYLGEGTTVMHEGFVNFNAGTAGPGMIEGRISAGVFVGAGSDLGGGSSTMGTLSGGGEVVISVGEHCLIGANAGIGISLGDRCTVEAGLYVTAGSPVTVLAADGSEVDTVKARTLHGKPDLLFRRNARSGRIECVTNRRASVLNEELHAHN